VSFAAITLYVASQQVLLLISLLTQSGNFWICPHTFQVFKWIISKLNKLETKNGLKI